MPREADFMRKQESKNANYEDNANTSNASSSSAWSRFNDPRIVRVSKALGGKDRHSKVCTVRGLRDRRVRLSVPTAIQLYDLQERLGVNQPSKVVDWLLDAAKHEIDELPPLHFPQGSLITQRFNPIIASQSDKQGLKIVGNGMSKETSDRNDDHHQSWTRSSGEERQLNLENQGDYVSTSDFLSRQNPSSFSSLLSSTTAPYNSFVRWDPSNLTLSHPPIGLGLTAHVEDSTNFNLSPQQLLVYQPSTNTQSYFPSQISPPTNTTFDLKQTNSTQPVIRPLQFNMTADLLPSQNNEVDKLHSS